MKEERRNVRRQYIDYTYDNLARKTSVEEETRQRNLEKIRNKSKKQAKAQERAVTRLNYGIDFISAIVLSLALACVFYFGLQYLTLDTKIEDMNRSVNNLSKTYASMQLRNDEAYKAVDDTVSISQVYKTAIKDLGMVLPTDDQIVTYQYNEEGYVRQYETLPEN